MSQPSSNASGLVGQCMGKYELVALVAQGGTAEIYLARIAGVAGFEKYVVVKLLHDHLAHDNEFVRMFLDEARLTAQLDHSNIVQTLELGEEKGRYYIVMEYLAGMSLSLIARRVVERVPGGRLPVELTLGIIAQACAGLHYAHQKTDAAGNPLNIIHRDVSPQNLVVSFEGIVKLVDFGIAKAEMRETHTKSGTIKGKFAYMSPEQCTAGEMDHRSDVFALGIIVHELLTGRRLFKRESTYETYRSIVESKVAPPSAVNHELDPALDEVVMKALAYDRGERYPTAEAFGEAMTSILYKRGKAVTAGTVAAFFEKHFAKEIDEHGARMRELVAGRQIVMDEQWDDPDGAGDMDEEVDDLDDLLPQDSTRDLSGLDAALAAADSVPGLRPRSSAGALEGEDEAATRVELPDMAEELAETDAGEEPSPSGRQDGSREGLAEHGAAARQDAGADRGDEARARTTPATFPGDDGPEDAFQDARAAGEAPTMALQVGASKEQKRWDGYMPSPVDVVTGAFRTVDAAETEAAAGEDGRPEGMKKTLLAMGGSSSDEGGAGASSPPVPRPPVVAASLSGPAGRRGGAASDDFSMATMQTEPAGPKGLMAAREAETPEDSEAPEEVAEEVAETVAREPAAVPSYPVQSSQDYTGRVGQVAAERGGERGIRELASISLPLWALAIIFVISVGIGLGATLLVAKLI